MLVRRFDPEQALELVARERISFLAGPPTFFIAMARALAETAQASDVSSVRLVSSGGASVTPAFVEDTARTFDCRVKRTYGSTEAPTVTTSTDDDPFEKARDTDGRAVGAGRAARVGPRDAAPRCATGAPGELWVRGPEMFAGYADAAQTAAVIARGGWFRTGDLATVDDEGWVRIVGRLKDVIIRGGENISASEVEAALEAHPDVRHAVAVGYPDPLMGERVAAFVESARAVRPRGVPALVRQPRHGRLQDAREGRAPRPAAAARLGQARPGGAAAPADRPSVTPPRRAARVAMVAASSKKARRPAQDPRVALARASPQPDPAGACWPSWSCWRWSSPCSAQLVGAEQRHRWPCRTRSVATFGDADRVDVVLHGPGQHAVAAGWTEGTDAQPGAPRRLRGRRTA